MFDWAASRFDPVTCDGRQYIIKRDDLLLPIGGNKARKLLNLSQQDLSTIPEIVSHGGAQSNAMLALSQFCKLKAVPFTYYTRPVPKWLKLKPIGNLEIALTMGMNWQVTETGLPSREHSPNTLFIPQGISMPEAADGISCLAQEISDYCQQNQLENAVVVLPSGTGATALYLQQFLNQTVYTVPCIGNENTLMNFFKVQQPNSERYPSIIYAHQGQPNYHFGQPHRELLNIYQQLLDETGIEFELLYDPKTWLRMLDWECDKPIIYIHNGGTSGNASMLARYRRRGMFEGNLNNT